MQKIANKWSEFAPRVHKEYPHLLAEMCKFNDNVLNVYFTVESRVYY